MPCFFPVSPFFGRFFPLPRLPFFFFPPLAARVATPFPSLYVAPATVYSAVRKYRQFTVLSRPVRKKDSGAPRRGVPSAPEVHG